jgi:hypothetical protein
VVAKRTLDERASRQSKKSTRYHVSGTKGIPPIPGPQLVRALSKAYWCANQHITVNVNDTIKASVPKEQTIEGVRIP